jgi:hypothetical protein
MSDGQTGAALIAAERARQVSEEGWTPEHDDGHTEGQLVDAACAYAASDRLSWPWLDGWKTHRDRVAELAKAGALIAAEIDRIQRQAVLLEQRKDQQ